MMDFYRVEHHTIMSGLVVRYCEIVPDGIRGCEVSASREGVLIQGGTFRHLRTDEDIEDFSSVLECAHEQAEHIASAGRYAKSLPFDHDGESVVELRKARFGGNDEVVERRPRLLEIE